MLHLREAWATVPLDRKDKTPIRGNVPAKHRKNIMTITATQLKEIRQEFATLKPASVTLEGNRTISVKEAVFALVPTLERMKKRGFDTQEIVEKLHEKGIEVKAPTLAKYLSEFRRRKEDKKGRKRDTPPPPRPQVSAPQEDTTLPQQPFSYSGSFVRPDTPDDEL